MHISNKWRRVRLSLLQLILLAGNSLFGQFSESFAIMDLEARGISAVEAQALTDRLSSLIVRSGRVTVVERGQMQAVLEEQDFQLTGCTSDECAVEVGQLLGVTKMVAGSIGKLGSTYSMDLRTINIETGKISNSIIRDYRGEIDGLLNEMVAVAKEIVDFEVGPEELLEALASEDDPIASNPLPQETVQQAPVKGAESQPEDSEKLQADNKGGGKGILWLVLAVAAAGGGAYAMGLRGDGGLPGDDGPTVGPPPGVPGQ